MLFPAEIFPLEVRARGNAWGVVGWSIGNGWLTLLCPVMFDAIGEKTLYIFGACNFAAVPMVWALYPESNQRTLEEMDLLFAADTPWVWDAERRFAELKAQMMAEGGGATGEVDKKAAVEGDPERRVAARAHVANIAAL
ncbi:mfs monosaccharide transporter [Diplodia corticola]|uniref:Mfs monosaccharide transporter n=1 Tax=Diplodia corticola TaxID=236234 RepID=A0A1J9R6Q5_9PEZI|nr:mfs monosaccharide transporter [Diplodia corticola]OJD35906.1 mfs monosaccharide transporter [Diplodia corticola]